jgi:EAL domain-containing protein (putative c-di-GMP-specific phosphodiesterase class I)
MQVVAKGVENEAQRGLLQHFGCDLAQGFLFAAALDAMAFDARIVANIGLSRDDPAPG